MKLTKSTQPILNLHQAPQLERGTLYLLNDNNTAGLPDGLHAVLRSAGGRSLELVTLATINNSPSAPGTYLALDDLISLKTRVNPTLRLYRASDTWRKVLSTTGAATVVPLLLALAAALVSIIFILSAAQATPTDTQTQALLNWVREPAVGVSDPTGVAKRADQAKQCLTLFAGGAVEQPPTIPGITCSPPTTSWWQDTTVGSIIIGAIGLLSAFLSFGPLRKRFGFQGTPTP